MKLSAEKQRDRVLSVLEAVEDWLSLVRQAKKPMSADTLLSRSPIGSDDLVWLVNRVRLGGLLASIGEGHRIYASDLSTVQADLMNKWDVLGAEIYGD